MPRGEPPGRTRTKKKSSDNAIVKWVNSYLRGMAGALGSAADPSANLAAQSSAFIPNQQLSAGGRVNSGAARDAINRRALEQYDPATMQAGAGILGAGIAGAALGRPAGAARLAARKATQSLAQREAQQAAQSSAARANASLSNLQNQLDAGGGPRRYTAEEMVLAAEAAERAKAANRPKRVTIRQPKPDRIKSDGPEVSPNFNRPPQGPRDMPKPPEPVRVDTRTTAEDGGVNVDNVIKNALGRKASKDAGLKKENVRVTWTGDKTPNHQQFKIIDENGKTKKWKDGFDSAKKSWKTAQTKSDPRNPNATDRRVTNTEAEMTPQELDQLRRAQMMDENPQIVAQLEDAAEEAYRRGGGMDFDETRRMMQEMPLGGRASRFQRGKVPARMSSPARGAEPVKRADETDAQFQKRYDEWSSARTNQTFRLSEKKQKRIKKPVKGIRKDGKPYKNGETEAAYQKRLDKWRAATGPQSRMATTEAERARTGQRLRDAQNVADMESGRFQPNVLADQPNPGPPGRQPDGGVSRRPGDPEVYQDPRGFRPSDMGPDEFTFYPRFLYDDLDSVADPRTIDLGRSYSAATSQRFGGPGTGRQSPAPLEDYPRFTPTRGKGSTRLRNVRKQAEESPKSDLTDKPAAPKTEPKEPSKPKKPKSRKPKETKKNETAQTEEKKIPKRGKKDDKKSPKKDNKQSENVRGGGENPRSGGEKPRSFIPAQVAKDATRDNAAARGRAARNDMDPGTAEEARLRGMDSATRGVIKPKAKESTRAQQGYLKAEQEKAIKDRAKRIYASGDRSAKKKFFGVAIGVGGPPAALAGIYAFNKARDEAIAADGAAEAAEEVVTAQEKSQEPKSKEAKFVLRDKYGRKITREEFNRREAYRKKLQGMSPDERKAARKKEMARREKWRNTIGKQLFKSAATKASRNTGKKKFGRMDDDARRALRAS
jgi:hypothetical protein